MERKTKVHVPCSHAHMFTTCLITCLSYQFTGRDMPLQKLSGWPFLCSYRNVGFSEYNPTQGYQLPKLGLRSTSSNAITAWGNTYKSTLTPITNLQKRVLRFITFSNYNDHSNPLSKALEIIKFQGAKIWNSLSEETKSLQRLAFKKTLKREVIQSY